MYFQVNINKALFTSLKAVQSEIYNCMCHMKMILRSYFKDPTVNVPGGVISSAYQLLSHGPIADQILAEYVVILDSQRIFDFLQPFYSNFITSVVKCIASQGAALVG